MADDDVTRIGEIPRAFLDTLGVGIALVDATDNRIDFANRELCRMLGCSLEELRSRHVTIWDLTHPGDHDANRAAQARFFAGEVDRYALEKRYVRPDGSILWARTIVTPVRNADNKVKMFCGVVEDITATKILQEQLAAAQKLAGLDTWHFVVEGNSANVTAVCLADGVMAPVEAPPLEDLVRRVHPDDREELGTAVQRMMARRSGASHEFRVVAADGSVRWIRGMASCVYDASAGRTHVVGVTMDITHVRAQATEQTPKPIQAILQDIERNWNERISIGELAARHGISARAVYRYFSARGISLADNIKHTRLRHARQMLSEQRPGMTVTSVALRCGFSNLGNFAADYRRMFGESPSETLRGRPYRKPADS